MYALDFGLAYIEVQGAFIRMATVSILLITIYLKSDVTAEAVLVIFSKLLLASNDELLDNEYSVAVNEIYNS